MKYIVLILLSCLLSCSLPKLNGSYESFWGDTHHRLDLKGDIFMYKSDGHLGSDEIEGNFIVKNDTILLLSKELEGFSNGFIIQNDSCLINLNTGYDYCLRESDSWESKLYVEHAFPIKDNDVRKIPPIKVEEAIFKTILDSTNVNGSILIYDLNKDIYHSNDYKWSNTGRLPASTFKIPNSIIALETGIIESDTSVFKWNGQKRAMAIWEQDLSLRNAFHYSCVPCYQEIARKVGVKRMNKYLDTLGYHNMEVTEDILDVFWLEGNSKISQFQQIEFLKRFYNSELAISERTNSIMKKMMIIKEEDGYTLRGKTGWAVRNGDNNGWFVGYLQKKDNTYFFATNIEPTESLDINRFASIRREVTYTALKQLSFM